MDLRNQKVLVVDDEEQINEVVKAYLESEGCYVYTAVDGNNALEIFSKEEIDFIVLDLMLPGLSGEEVCKRIRVKSQVPILMLTAKGDEINRIYGLDIGADDYMVKPFSPKELVARVKAIVRRTKMNLVKANIIEFNKSDLVIDMSKFEVIKGKKILYLTSTEFRILTLLAQNVGRVFSREDIVIKIFGYDYEGYERTVDTHIKNIRQKIDDKFYKYIKTIYGIGYKFEGIKDVQKT